MKIKVSEATGPTLDWMVEQANGGEHTYKPRDYSGEWSFGGPIIEREGIEIKKGNPLIFPKGNEKGEYSEPLWIAGKMHGRTTLEAAMRCFVASKLGDEVEVPEELT